MARQTKKYVAAVDVGRKNKIRATGSADDLYQKLEMAGYWWNASEGSWTNAPKPARGRRISIEGLNAKSSSSLLQIRLVAPEERMVEVVNHLMAFAQMSGYTFLQHSDPYPADNGARVYMEFVLPNESGKADEND
jgi:hypothetical protein